MWSDASILIPRPRSHPQPDPAAAAERAAAASAPPQQAELYLSLLKKCLSFALWEEPPMPALTFDYQRPRWKRAVARVLAKLCRLAGCELMQPRRSSEQDRREGRTWPGLADTMVGMGRLDNLQTCVETALADGVPGDLIETGVWRGGACILMRAVLAAHGVEDRRVFVADSFAGLPPPDLDAHPQDAGDTHHQHAFLAVSADAVRRNFAKYDLLDEQVVFLEGWFADTLPKAPIERLAVMRLDGDMYGSTMDALENLYPKLSPGGFCIIDDYALPGCRAAVEDFRTQHRIRETLHEVDWTGRWWRRG